MTVDDIRRRIATIDDIADDYEAAHREEDRLHADVLEAIAGGAADAGALAAAALESRGLVFDRHYAEADPDDLPRFER
jgi:hypothetical protein